MGCFTSTSSSNKTNQNNISNEDKAIAELKITRDKVKRYERKLDSNIGSCKSAVKECIHNKSKEKALLALRKQKYLEKALGNTRNELLNLEQLINDVENAQIQRDIYGALKEGNEFLKNINQQLTIDDVEKLMEETHEAIQYQQEVSEALSRQGFTENQDDLLEELEKLDEAEALEYDLPSVPVNPLPGKLQEKKQKEKKQKEKKQEGLVVA